MKDDEHRLLQDEARLLRNEANKLQQTWENKWNSWVVEKSNLNQEIKTLRESLNSVEDYYKEASETRDREINVLRQHYQLLQEKQEYYQKLADDKVQTDKHLRELRTRDLSFKEQKGREIIEALQAESERAHQESEDLKSSSEQKMRDLEKAYQNKIKLLEEKEGTITYQNQ